MTNGAANRVFIDANILVYASVASAPFYAEASRVLAQLYATLTELWISRQTLREYLATLSRPQTFTRPLPADVLIASVETYIGRFHIAEDGPLITRNLLTLLATIPTGGKQIHDANIVATMQAYEIGSLLTNNVADFNRYVSLITIVPLQ